ncbi:DUF1822 family protein [Nostoc sp. UHCC 0251]|uniref:DUF1822 family protein n=1 Tax=Nostoc sp. UHCC 0251 TaxID=3110240 RepID=UPI002B1FD883|nr:DUF1822 family protein [Nostoc sp. UHCC 0251]
MIEALTFTVPIPLEAHRIAQQLSQAQFTAEKARKVYHNILAVHAVDFYLRCMGLDTDFDQSDSHDKVMLTFTDVADLEVKNYGKLECRPVLSDAEVCYVPPDVWSDRIGYMVVHLNESLQQAKIIGFATTVSEKKGILPIRELRILAEFSEYLSHIRQPKPVKLRQWFEGIFEAGWLGLKELLSEEQIELAFGSARNRQSGLLSPEFDIIRARKIDLGMQLVSHSLALIVIPRVTNETEVDLIVQLHPIKDQFYLPESVQMKILDKNGTAVLDNQSRGSDNYIQLKFTAEPGDLFSIAVSLENASVTESFFVAEN